MRSNWWERIDDTEYTVSNVITDTSFDITSTVATLFDGDYIHSPFSYVPNLELQFITVWHNKKT